MEAEDDGDLIYVGEDQGGADQEDVVEKEEYYGEAGAEGVESVEIMEEQEGDLNEESYEIRDEEDNIEINPEDLEKEPTVGIEKTADEKGVSKDDNLLVVDEWDNEESISDEEDLSKTEDGKELPDPEEAEKALLHMPSLKTIMGDLLHLRRNRRLSMYPMSIADISNPIIQQHLESETCEEVKMQFIRPTEDMKTWTGFLSVTFVTSKNATQAVEALKAIREELTVKVDTNPEASLDTFLKGEKKNTAWPQFWSDRLLLARSIPSDTKPDDLRAIFTDAEEIVVAKESSSGSWRRRDSQGGGGSVPGYAYVLYETPEAAKKAVGDMTATPVEFNQKPLDVHLYREPVTEIPRALLYLRRRRLVLRHLDKLLHNEERAKTETEYKLPPWTETRIAACKAIIEKDDKARADLHLPTPSYEDFKQMRGFKPFRSQDAERILISLGILTRTKKTAPPNNAGRRDNKDNKPGNRRNDRDNKGRGGGRGNYRRGGSPRDSRRSPPGGRRRNDWGSGDARRGSFMGRNRPGGPRGGGRNQPSGGGLGMMNPLAVMMQQNMGLLGASGLVNPALLNQMMMQPGAPMGMGGLMSGGGGGMSGPGPMSLLGNLSGGGPLEPPPKMLRLDETGNLRDFRSDRGFNRGPRDGGAFRDRGRQRSRSPDIRYLPPRSRQDPAHGGGNIRSGFEGDRMGGPRGFEPSGSGAHGGGGPSRGEDDINLLMNLSKMLSQKMEQKRQQVEHGYDRM